MITALIYISVSVLLVLLLSIAATERHAESSGSDVFRYPRAITWVSACGAPLWVAVSVFAYTTFLHKPIGLILVSYVGINSMIALLFLWGFVAVKRFAVEIRSGSTHVQNWRGRREVRLRETRRFVTVDGGRGGQEFCAFDGNGKVLLKASSVLQDYEELRALVERQLPERGVSYEHRDALGRWQRT